MSETKEQYEARMAAAIAARNEDGTAPANKAAGAKAVRGRPSSDAGRWHTLNAFYDFCAEHLTPTEKAVWAYLNRHCRNGKANGSMREIARNARVDFKTAAVALKWLEKVGLIWVVFKSKHKGTSTVYGLHLNPERRRDACEAADAPRKERKKRRPAPTRARA